jgi:glucosamine--fructose-6-phosphate aminotransferase (isomerizing)
MSIMLQEIYEQPGAIESVLDHEVAGVNALVAELRAREIRHVVIAARGTSDNAATYAKYLFEIVVGVPVGLAAPSVFTLYDAEVDLRGTLMLGISQSGQAPDVVQTLSSARAMGALTACITNVEDSPITGVSDFTLLCYAGPERAVAATKTYTTALAAIALLAAMWARRPELMDELRGIPDMIRTILPHTEEIIKGSVERFRFIHECAVLARGLNQPTALEAALKMTETSYIVAKPYSAADFLHGPVAMVSEGFPCFLYAPDGRAYSSMLDLAVKLRERLAEMVIVAHSEEILKLAVKPIKLTVTVDELLSPLVYIVPGQLWACHLAGVRGQNPDSPRGLSKVTLTR